MHLTPAEADVLRTGQRGAKNQLRLLAKRGQGLQRTQLSQSLDGSAKRGVGEEGKKERGRENGR